MGAKFFKTSNRGKKYLKRFNQSRSWFRGLKWVACKSQAFINEFRSRSPRASRGPPIQGWWCFFDWNACEPWDGKVRHSIANVVRATKPNENSWFAFSACTALIYWLLRCLLRLSLKTGAWLKSAQRCSQTWKTASPITQTRPSHSANSTSMGLKGWHVLLKSDFPLNLGI